ncbi:hypothetical protein G6011_00829 [Alternaria panax]|uniref:Uncharacterized protein n=1 Tax=Alternaria panax TaxID=48097 RepID=A0AAD4IJ05_9PLEO|nr:hypothetical protein G6011_00829 [Alternaria panax]
MSTHMNTVSPTQLGSSMNALPLVNMVSEAEIVQNDWGNDRAPSDSLALEAPARQTNDTTTTTPDVTQTKATEPDDEEYGEFVEASTEALEQPIYDTTEEDDEMLGLLDSRSAPVWEAESYIGIGIVEPVYAGVNMAARSVRNMARWKRNDTRANMIVAEWKRKRTQRVGRAAVSIAAAAAAAAAAAPSPAKDDAAAPATSPARAVSNQYLEAPRAATSNSNMNGVMRPVHFAGSAIDELVETERSAWGP